MEDQKGKTRFILVFVLICLLLIAIQTLLILTKFYYIPLHALLLLCKFILAISILFALPGWRTPTWKRICIIAFILAVIAWTLYWLIAAILILPALAPMP